MRQPARLPVLCIEMLSIRGPSGTGAVAPSLWFAGVAVDDGSLGTLSSTETLCEQRVRRVQDHGHCTDVERHGHDAVRYSGASFHD